ncbi:MULTISPECIES: hypothetical protein [unclassified Streptomyces]|uniref:hypothetical protein n=1 Tax=unclassified Streptomyces TaxID=2593676 RepID=UPI0036F5B536
MIDPGGIFQYTGDWGTLSKAVSELRTHAIGIRSAGQDVHSRFQATAAYYKAPEADQLFSSTQPVMDTADEFAAHIESLADALDTFAAEAKPHADRLKHLKEQAIAFVDSVEGDDDWTKDQHKVDTHKALMDGVAEAVAGFRQAEHNAAVKIGAISPAACRPVDDGSGTYTVTADILKSMPELPWGTPEGRTYDRWSLDWWGHGVKSWVWDGFVKESLWGGFVGLGVLEDNLLGINGSEAQHQTWEGLRRTVVGAYAYGMDGIGLGDHLSDWQRDSKAYAKEFGKQFIAYDEWSEDPARAHAVTSFNVLTVFAGAGGVLAKLGKGGRFVEAAGAVAKVGDALDPVSGAARTARALSDLPKVSEVLTNVGEHLRLPKTRFPDGALDDLSNRYRVDKDGNFIALKPDGTPDTKPVRHEPAAAERTGGVPSSDRVLAGVSARTGEAGPHADSPLPPRARHDAGDAHGGNAGSAPEGGHLGVPSGGHSTEHHGADHHGGDAGGGAEDSTGHGHDPGGSSGGWDGHPPSTPHGPSPDGEGRPMARGGETERKVLDAVRGIPGSKRPKPNVMERVLDRLASEPDGQRVADIIASGQFNQSDEYGQVISAMGAKREQMFQPAADQLMFADDLVRSGVPAHAIDFEQKFPVGADMDIRIRDESGEVYAYQMKHLNDPQDPVSEITRGKYLLQLASAEADHSVLLVDGGRGTIAEWMANGSYDELMAINGGARGRKGMGITFVVRLEDGNLVIPPGSKTDPKGML